MGTVLMEAHHHFFYPRTHSTQSGTRPDKNFQRYRLQGFAISLLMSSTNWRGDSRGLLLGT